MPAISAPSPKAFGRSVLFYPLVGVVIGLILVFMAWSLEGVASSLRAVLLLIVWVWLTGGLHLDGLADVTDGWIGGMGSREKILAILKDPQSGPGAIVAVVLLLLTKFAALEALLESNIDLWWLLSVPLFGRLGIVFLLLTLPYVRKTGMGAEMADNIPRKSAWFVLIGFVTIVSVLLVGAVVPLLAAAIFLILFRHKIRQNPGGVTGDFLGAGCEMTETVYLISIAFIPLLPL